MYGSSERMAIVSLLVKVPWAPNGGSGDACGTLGQVPGRLLHHHLVCKLLNDLYGIQARSGCSCAAPYGQRLLGMREEEVEAHYDLIACGEEAVRVGWTRLSLSFAQHPLEVEYLAAAIHQVRPGSRSGRSRSQVKGSTVECVVLPSIRCGLDHNLGHLIRGAEGAGVNC